MKPNGYTTAHGKTWPMWEREAFSVEIEGRIEVDSAKEAEDLKNDLLAALPLGVKVNIIPVSVVAMSEEDQAEKDALDKAAMNRAA